MANITDKTARAATTAATAAAAAAALASAASPANIHLVLETNDNDDDYREEDFSYGDVEDDGDGDEAGGTWDMELCVCSFEKCNSPIKAGGQMIDA